MAFARRSSTEHRSPPYSATSRSSQSWPSYSSRSESGCSAGPSATPSGPASSRESGNEMTETQTVARPTGLKSPPQSLQLRPYAGEADLPVVVALFNRALEHDGVPRRWQLGDAKAQYSHPNDNFDPARDVTIAELDGNVVGFGERSWVDTALEEIRDYRIDGAVLPEWQRRGIGTAILADSIERTREHA